MNPRPVGIGFGSGRKPPNSAKMRSRWPPPAEATSPVVASTTTTTTRTTCEILTSAPSTSTTTTAASRATTRTRTATATASTANTRIQIQEKHNRNYWSNPRSQLSTLAVLLLAIVALNNLDTFLAPAAASLARQGQSQTGESPIYSIYILRLCIEFVYKDNT